jgi:hypothetical protein
MTITPKFRTVAFASCIVSIILLLVVGLYRTNFPQQENIVYDTVYTIAQLAYLIALFYVIELLIYAGEAKVIVVGYYIFTGLVLITSIIGFASFPPVFMMKIASIINIAFLLSTLYVIVVSFMVKSPALSIPFKVFAFLQIFVLIFTFGVTLLLAYLSPALYFKISRYMHFGGLIVSSAIAYIIYASERLVSGKNADLPQ